MLQLRLHNFNVSMDITNCLWIIAFSGMLCAINPTPTQFPKVNDMTF